MNRPIQKTLPTWEQFWGCLLGMAIGDARGLPYEGLGKRRLQAMFPKRDSYQLLPGYGLCSDDTEHAYMTAQALLFSTRTATEPEKVFCRNLAWRLRFWLLGLPAGIGMATLKSICKLWLGFPITASGVFSAGNGPVMRAPLLGVWSQDMAQLRRLVRLSTRLTHTDPQAESGALLIAWVAHRAARYGEKTLGALGAGLEMSGLLSDGCIAEYWGKIETSIHSNQDTVSFAASIGCEDGVSGYVWHTVPVVLHAYFSHPEDFDTAICAVIDCGGDTDTTAAILGALVGIHTGESGIRPYWRKRLLEWPRTIAQMKELARRLAQASHTHPPAPTLPLSCLPFAWVGILLRNLLFMPLVLLHGFRRLLPPY